MKTSCFLFILSSILIGCHRIPYIQFDKSEFDSIVIDEITNINKDLAFTFYNPDYYYLSGNMSINRYMNGPANTIIEKLNELKNDINHLSIPNDSLLNSQRVSLLKSINQEIANVKKSIKSYNTLTNLDILFEGGITGLFLLCNLASNGDFSDPLDEIIEIGMPKELKNSLIDFQKDVQTILISNLLRQINLYEQDKLLITETANPLNYNDYCLIRDSLSKNIIKHLSEELYDDNLTQSIMDTYYRIWPIDSTQYIHIKHN